VGVEDGRVLRRSFVGSPRHSSRFQRARITPPASRDLPLEVLSRASAIFSRLHSRAAVLVLNGWISVAMIRVVWSIAISGDSRVKNDAENMTILYIYSVSFV
jgi:hypothetical protein